MRFRYFWILLAFLGSSPVAGHGTPAYADETLDRLLDQAVASNPTILAARQRWEAAKAEAPQARALEDPELSVTLWSIPSNFDLTDASETWYGLSQAVPFPGKRGLRGRAAEAGAQAAEQAYLATVRAVRSRVKELYARLYRVQRSIAIHREHQSLLEEFIKVALTRYGLGQVPQQESLKAQLELSSLHASLLALEQEQQSVRVELNTAIGRPDDPLFFGTAHVAFEPLMLSVEELEHRAFDERPELNAAHQVVAQQEDLVALAGRSFYPDFMAEVSYWDVHDGPNRWMLMGRMTLPWVAAGKYRAKIAQERAGLARAEAEQEATRQATSFLVRNVFLKLKTAEALVHLYRTGIVPQAEQALESARIAYTAGQTDLLNLIDAERNLRDVHLAADVALADWAEGRAELERMVGDLS